ncbi:hypothetical protein BBJ28_00024531 [Nothophytophthora sp. Chile5]|nr:hypothetical protein BBJ28_00024531 [Nothophytophthora sp. Chile5]
MAIDSIDEDELYPYFPSERVRLDTSGAIVLTANRRKAKGSSQKPSGLSVEGLAVPNAEGELVVTLRRAAFLKLYHPQFPVSEATPDNGTLVIIYFVLSSQIDQQSYPLYTRINLTKDWGERRATLMEVREKKLRDAYEFIMAPGRFPNSEITRHSYQRFETAGGDICCVHLQTVQFPGVESLRQVFDAVMFYVQNMEISISERLGHITVRDDYDSIEGSVYNTRVLSTNQSGTVIESSMVAFPHVFGGDEEPGAIVVVDSVDEDELYPYLPSARVRRDISGAIALTSSRRKAEDAESKDDGGLVVTMRRAAFLKLHHPQFPISEDAQQEMMAGIAQWGDVMIRTIRDVVYMTP